MSYFSRAATKLKRYFSLLWHQIRYPEERKSYSMKDLEQTHTCANCGLEYNGLFCPRCGQKSNTQRLTPKNLLSNTLEVWDFNNRSVPGTIIQLFTRPGHFIRDYLKGHRAPYYAPIKLLFLLCVILAIEVSVGLIKPEKKSVNSTEKPKSEEEIRARDDSLAWAWADDDYEDDLDKDDVEMGLTLSVNGDTAQIYDTYVPDSLNTEKAVKFVEKHNKIRNAIVQFILAFKKLLDFRENNKALYTILLNITLAFICWWVFRKEKFMGHLSYTEHFFIQIYISCQMLILSILILPFLKAGADLPIYILPAIMIWDFKQLFQISRAKSLLRTVLVLVLNGILMGIVISLGLVLSFLFIALINGAL